MSKRHEQTRGDPANQLIDHLYFNNPRVSSTWTSAYWLFRRLINAHCQDQHSEGWKQGCCVADCASSTNRPVPWAANERERREAVICEATNEDLILFLGKVPTSDSFSHVANRPVDDNANIEKYISDVFKRTVVETLGSSMREQARRKQERVEQL